MAQVLLVTVDDAVARLQLNADLVGDMMQATVKEAITAAQLYMEGLLDTHLQYGEYQDVFYLDPDANSGIQPGGLFRLYLKTGFVRVPDVIPADPSDPTSVPIQPPTVEFQQGMKWNDVSIDVDPTLIRVDTALGIVYADAETCNGKYATVTYTAGFMDGDPVPEWLREAILSYVPVTYALGAKPDKDKTTATFATGIQTQRAEHTKTVSVSYNRRIGMITRRVM